MTNIQFAAINFLIAGGMFYIWGSSTLWWLNGALGVYFLIQGYNE